MGVGFRRLAMRRPAGVADADRALKRRGGKLRLQVLELPSARRRSSLPFSSVATPAES